ncbi:MAG: MFS transporter [Bacillota bacterium]
MENIRDRNIIKFGFYGFFKNLRFFEPYIYLYFLAIGLSYFEIGLIISIRELSMYIFEIPSGFIADIWGKKKSMLLCFVLYIISFIIYYFSHSFWILALASIIFGLGEAFRSGTHKGIIFDYLDWKGISSKKTQVYGFTRSVALYGKALSAVIAAVLLIWLKNYHIIFLFSIIPYICDFILILTYPPERSSGSKREFNFTEIKKHFKDSLSNLLIIKRLRKILINSAIFDGVFKASRDYIQPVIRNFIMAYPILVVIENEQNRETLLIAILYLLINIFGAFSSRWSHKLENYCYTNDTPLNYLFLGQAFLLFITGYFIEMNLYVVIFLFLILNIINNLRRPLLLCSLVNEIEDVQRVTMLSVESQLKSLAVVALAPLLGLIADLFSIRFMFISVSVLLVILYLIALELDTGHSEKRSS